MSQKVVDSTIQPKAGTFATIPSDKDIAAELKEASGESEPNEQTIEAVPAAVAADDGLPEKFKGKSASDIASSYANLEQELGRKSQEVGSLRVLTDQLLELRPTVESRSAAAPQDDLPELTADDVLNDPRSAIQGVARIEAGVVGDRVDALEAQLNLNAFESRHPTFRADQTDEKFQTFIAGSIYKQGLAQKAATGDLGAAEELWSAYEEGQPGEPENVKEPTADEQEALDSAAAIANRGGGESTQPGLKPISRHDLAKVKIEDEDRYYSPAFQAYVQKMYGAGLVK